jgi:hypothetical protein
MAILAKALRIFGGKVSTWLHIKACVLYPLYIVRLFLNSNSKHKEFKPPLSWLPLSFVIGVPPLHVLSAFSISVHKAFVIFLSHLPEQIYLNM